MLEKVITVPVLAEPSWDHDLQAAMVLLYDPPSSSSSAKMMESGTAPYQKSISDLTQHGKLDQSDSLSQEYKLRNCKRMKQLAAVAEAKRIYRESWQEVKLVP